MIIYSFLCEAVILDSSYQIQHHEQSNYSKWNARSIFKAFTYELLNFKELAKPREKIQQMKSQNLHQNSQISIQIGNWF